MGFGFFGVFEVLFFIVFFLALAAIVVNLARSVAQWSKNNHAPRLTVPATVVSKRTAVSHRHHGSGAYYRMTTYYATFQVASGDRMELSMSGQEYGLLAEGDRGDLSFQGTRYLGFVRT